MPLHDWTRVDPNDFHSFHLAWIAALQHALNAGLLPPGYSAMAEHVTPPVVADVLTLTVPGSRRTDHAASLTLAPTRPKATASGRMLAGQQQHQRRIVIRHARNRTLVAVIEIVSPSNKKKEGDFAIFLDKSVAFLNQGINLMVLDPFPPTRRDPNGIHAAIWKSVVNKRYTIPTGKPRLMASYNVRSTDDDTTCSAYLQAANIGNVLNDLPLYLDGDRFVTVPLQATYDYAWDGFAPDLKPLLLIED